MTTNGNGSIAGGGTKNSDIALLQSLLPGVHITSDSSAGGFAGGMAPNWAAPGPTQSQANNNNLGGSTLHPQQNWGGAGGSGGNRMQQSHVGAIGQTTQQQNQRQNPGIW